MPTSQDCNWFHGIHDIHGIHTSFFLSALGQSNSSSFSAVWRCRSFRLISVETPKKKKTQDFPPAPPLGSLSSRRVSYAQDLEVAGHWTMIASNSVCCCRWVNLTGLHLLTLLSLSACPSLLRDWFRARSRNKHDFYLLHSMEVEMNALLMLCCCQNFFTEQQTHFLLLLSDILPLSH